MYQKPSAALGGKAEVNWNWLVKLTPLTVRLARFQELMLLPRLLERQQSVPAPSKVKGAAIVELTGLHVTPPAVGVRVAVATMPVGVRVRVAVAVGGVLERVGVRVGVLLGPWVRVGVRVGAPPSTADRAGNHLSAIFWKPALFGWMPSLVSVVVSKPVHWSTTMIRDCEVLKPAAQLG